MVRETKKIFPAVTLCHPLNFLNLELKNMLVICKFALKECNANDFETIQIFDPIKQKTLKCFRFNGGRNITGHNVELKKANNVGVNSGLQMLLNVNYPFYYHISDNQELPLAKEVYSESTLPLLNNIKINKIVEKKLEEPYNNCRQSLLDENSYDSWLFKETIKTNFSYRQLNCFENCLMHFAIGKHKCSKDNFCQSYFELEKEFDYSKNCSKYCPLECESIIYSTKKDLSDLPFPGTILNIVLDDLIHMEIKQIAKTNLPEIISNVGGTFGLFIGISILSFIELFEFLFMVLIELVKNIIF
jgi:hypothetical protein